MKKIGLEPEFGALLDFDSNFCFSLNFVEGSQFRGQISIELQEVYYLLCV